MQCVICLYLHFNCESCHHFSLQNFDSRGQFFAQRPLNRNWQHPNKFEREKRNTENPPHRANDSASDAIWRYTMSCNAHCVHVAIVSAINERQKRKNKIFNIVEKKIITTKNQTIGNVIPLFGYSLHSVIDHVFACTVRCLVDLHLFSVVSLLHCALVCGYNFISVFLRLIWSADVGRLVTHRHALSRPSPMKVILINGPNRSKPKLEHLIEIHGTKTAGKKTVRSLWTVLSFAHAHKRSKSWGDRTYKPPPSVVNVQCPMHLSWSEMKREAKVLIENVVWQRLLIVVVVGAKNPFT